jgi:hypothetical protein
MLALYRIAACWLRKDLLRFTKHLEAQSGRKDSLSLYMNVEWICQPGRGYQIASSRARHVVVLCLRIENVRALLR